MKRHVFTGGTRIYLLRTIKDLFSLNLLIGSLCNDCYSVLVMGITIQVYDELTRWQDDKPEAALEHQMSNVLRMTLKAQASDSSFCYL